jgi:RNA polymerase sigma factor (sigma-70 family)
MPERQREVVELHLLQGKSLAEVARLLGVSKNAVWERLQRGLERLREALGDEAP